MARLNGGEYLLKLKTEYSDANPELEHPEIIREICENGNVKSVIIQDINGVLLIPIYISITKKVQFYIVYSQTVYNDDGTLNNYESFEISYIYNIDSLSVSYTSYEV